MPIDSGAPLTGARRPDWELPEIIDLEIRRVPFEPPKHRHFESTLPRYPEAMEFLVRTDGPIPSRALGPALFVGDVQVAESRLVGESLYRFLSFEIDRLEPGAPISWGWMFSSERDRRRTSFAFRE
jgi:hypothetical protein